tara:strand:- start:93 stop:557 length:465 start_codon:yes stop_codon:yes gene_type:complete
MKLVLLKDIKHLGKVGDEVTVKGGFARNYLLPSKSALTVSEENLEIINKMKDDLIKQEQEAKEKALALKDKLSNYEQTFNMRVKEESDELFGSITLQTIVDQMKTDGLEIEKKQINLPMGPIKSLGVFHVNVSLHSEVGCDIKITVSKSEETEE